MRILRDEKGAALNQENKAPTENLRNHQLNIFSPIMTSSQNESI